MIVYLNAIYICIYKFHTPGVFFICIDYTYLVPVQYQVPRTPVPGTVP